MLFFRGLPPFARITRMVGQFCYLTSSVLGVWALATILISHAAGKWESESGHVLRILLMMQSLFWLGFACTTLSRTYRSVVRSPDTAGFPFRSWQQQACIMALVAVLPIGAFVVALVGPLFTSAFIAMAMIVATPLVTVAANLWAITRPIRPTA